MFPVLQGGFLVTEPPGKSLDMLLSFFPFPLISSFASLFVHAAAAAKLLQSGPTLCDPTDGSPPGSYVPGILQARTLEWDAISFSNA